MLASGLIFVAARPAVADPGLTVSSPVVPGGQATVIGRGFSPNAHVAVQWEGAAVAVAGVRADRTGHFEITVTVPETLTAGSYTVTATEHRIGGETARSVVADLQVVTADAGAPSASSHDQHEIGDFPAPVEEPDLPIARVAPEESADTHDVSGQHDDHDPTTAPAPASADPTAPAHTAHSPETPHPTPTPGQSHGGHAAASGNPVDCTGYPEPRTFLEVHTWWEGEPLPSGQVAHLHAGTCFPLGQTVSGKIAFDVRIIMHDNPGHLFRYETGLHTDGHGEGDLPIVPLDHRCPSTCEFWVRTVVDTSRANDGWHEIRVKPRVELSNGEVQLTSTGWPIRTENGNADGGSRSDSDGARLGITGRGWYDGHGYQNAVLSSPEGVLPGQVVSGVWKPTVRLDAGSGGDEPTFTAAYVDPDFHHNDEDSTGGGMVIGTWNGELRGPISIDTRRLSNGPHTLVLRVEANAGGTRLTGLQYVPIFVRN